VSQNKKAKLEEQAATLGVQVSELQREAREATALLASTKEAIASLKAKL
jgi:hypothetical protein